MKRNDTAMEHVLKANLICKSFGKIEALNNVSFLMSDGIHALIGANGAGKSTLIHILSTNLNASKGMVTYNGKSIMKLGKEYRTLIGVMPQHQEGYDSFSGIEFLYYLATLKGIPREVANKQITDLVNQAGLKEAIFRPIQTYSGGMRQRLMFAQAFLGHPKIVILDEPTSGLDPYERIRMRNYIRKVARNRIVIIATHVMQDVESIADNLLLMKQGKLIFSGTGASLIASLSKHIFEEKVSQEAVSDFETRVLVSRISKIGCDYIVRYIDPNRSDGILNANMEDVYLYYMVDRNDALV